MYKVTVSGAVMNNREINKDNSAIKKDENIENICCKQISLGIRVCFLVMLFEMLVLLFTNEHNYGIYALLFSFSCADGFEDYKMKKKKFYLLASAVSFILAAYSLYLFVVGAVG